MPPRTPRLLLAAAALLLAAPGSSLPRSQLLPYGERRGDARLPPGDDVVSDPLQLTEPMHYYRGRVPALQVGTNGYISISKPSKEAEYLGIFPPGFGSVSPFLADLDTTDGRGEIFYREDTSYETLQLVQEHIKRGFPNVTFIPASAVIVTWEEVAPYYEQRGDAIPENKRNTFQSVLASDRSSSYAIFLYPEDGMQFYGTQSRKAYSEEQMIPAKVGFNKGPASFLFWQQQGPKHEIASDEQSVKNLVRSSNSGRQGVWVFEIGSSPDLIVAAEISYDPEETGESEHQYPVVVPSAKIQSSDMVEEDNHLQERYDDPNNGEDTHTFTEQPKDDSQDEVSQHRAETDAAPKDLHVDQQPDHIHLKTKTSQFPQQNPQVVVVDEVFDNTGIVFHYNTGNRETCSNNRHQCSNQAYCKDYATGFCCSCLQGYYGNGRQCVAEGSPQRVNGKVKGRIYVGSNPSPVLFKNIDLHSYVVVNDGRSYTAISTIQESLGFSLLPLASVGGIIGWMFALEQPGSKNGFSLTGGEFTRQAEVSFLQGNEKLVIKQQFSGIDEHGHLSIDTELEGRVPEIPFGSSVIIEPYTELYHSSSSVVTSSSTREYTVEFPEGEPQTYTYQWRQTITFQECIHDTTDVPSPGTQQLSVDRVFVLYNTEEQILRYALSNSIGPVSDGPDDKNRNPCYIGSHGCDTNAVCRPGQGNQFSCECSAGFRGEGRTCFDIDECIEQPTVCGSNTICNNQPGTFRCECIDGYQFSDDGRTCVAVERPINPCVTGTHTCDSPERARCIYTGASSYICACLSGFSGDGRSCVDVDECQTNRCHPDAICYNSPGSFTCQCKAAYQGDGFHCVAGETEKTKCQHIRESVLGAGDSFSPRGPRPVGQFIPQCDEQGNFKPVQCHSSSGYCWCVDREGNELDGTRTGPGVRPPCLDTVTYRPPVGPTVRPDIMPLTPGTHLLFAQSGKIEHVPLEGTRMKKTDAKSLLHVPDKVIIGVAYDCVDKMVYWTEISGPSISRASITGGEPTAVIKTDLGSPEGITVDHLGRNIFWTDSQQDRIEMAKLDGSQRLILFDTGLVNPRGIVADPARGNLYWTDWNRDAPKIETSYLDGTNRRILVKDDLGLPNGLTVDPYSSVLCWVDAGTKRVECMNPNQPGRRKILEGVQYPFGITSYGNTLYYTDWRRDAVVAVDRTSSEENDDFQPHKRSRIYGITTAYAQCPPGHNYCTLNNGGCTHLCLATPGGRSCRCPESTVGVECLERN